MFVHVHHFRRREVNKNTHVITRFNYSIILLMVQKSGDHQLIYGLKQKNHVFFFKKKKTPSQFVWLLGFQQPEFINPRILHQTHQPPSSLLVLLVTNLATVGELEGFSNFVHEEYLKQFLFQQQLWCVGDFLEGFPKILFVDPFFGVTSCEKITDWPNTMFKYDQICSIYTSGTVEGFTLAGFPAATSTNPQTNINRQSARWKVISCYSLGDVSRKLCQYTLEISMVFGNAVPLPCILRHKVKTWRTWRKKKHLPFFCE